MSQPRFATYLHPETTRLSKPAEQIAFVGQSWPHFAQIRQQLHERMAGYAALPLRIAPLEQFGSVHSAEYLAALQQMASDTPPMAPPRLSIECSGMWHCLPAYQASLGGMLAAVEQLADGALERAYCFSMGGHHAYNNWGHGYCLLNPMAAAIRYAQAQGLARVLVLDWDLHHGDGTQAIFANDPTVHCISIHSAADLYMASACGLYAGTTSAAASLGHRNIPVLNPVFDSSFFRQMGLPGEFYRAAEVPGALQRALDEQPWRPDLIAIFSGYDAHRDDCGRQITGWDEGDFALLTRMALDHAARMGCGVLSVHGGGYTPPVTVASALRHVEELASYRPEAR